MHSINEDSELKSFRSKQFADFIKKERSRLLLTQKEFAEKIGSKTSTVDALEAKGLNHKIKIYGYLEKLGYEPEKKLNEILEKN